MCDEKILTKIKTIISCANCQALSIANLCYEQPCHNGVYCKACISYCTQCSRTQGKPIESINQMLLHANFKCIYSNLGCTSICNWNTLPSHEQTCLWKHQEQISKPFFPTLDKKITAPNAMTKCNVMFSMEFVHLYQQLTRPEEIHEDIINSYVPQ